eukprot:s1172_g9.t1
MARASSLGGRVRKMCKARRLRKQQHVAPRARLGTRDYLLRSAHLGELRDSAELGSDPRAASRLRARLWADGYLFVRSLLPADTVRAAQLSLLNQMQILGLADGEGKASSSQEQHAPDLCSPEVLAVLNHPELFSFLDHLFDQELHPLYGSANLRAVRPGESTGFHTDSVYMGKLMDKNLPPVIACWIPVTPIPLSLGGLVICRGSNSHPGFQRFRETYGKLDLDEADIAGTGWYTEDPQEVLALGGRFETAEFQQGDVVFFTMHTMHGSSCNCTDRWRLSLDFRVQAASQRDGTNSQNKGRWSRLRHDPSEFPRTMEQAKVSWGLTQGAPMAVECRKKSVVLPVTSRAL